MPRRQGLTMIELLVAAAMLSLLLLAAWGSTFQSWTGNVSIDQRERADLLSRNLIERFSRMPLHDLEELFRMRSVIDLADHWSIERMEEGAWFQDPDLSAELRYQRIEGEWPRGYLSTRVSWKIPGGAPRWTGHDRFLAAPEPLADGIVSASGFSADAGGAGWGHRGSWSPASTTHVALKASLQAAVGAVLDPEAEDLASGHPLPFRGDPEVAARLTGQQGELARRRGDPERKSSARRARREARFLARAGVPTETWLEEVIPDGSYRYRLEAVELDGGERDRVVGVYVLDGPAERLHLVTRRQGEEGATVRRFEGDQVLATRHLASAAGDRYTLFRTEERLYLIPLARGLELELRSLPAFDTGTGGTAATRRQVEELVRNRRLVDATAPTRDDLTRALTLVGSGPRTPTGLGGRRPLCGPGQSCGSLRRSEIHFLGTRPSRTPTSSLEAADSGASEVPGSDELEAARRLAHDDPAAALTRLDELLRRQPSELQARALRGRLRASLGDEPGAIEDLRFVARDASAEVPELRDLAALLLRARQVADAEAVILRLRDLVHTVDELHMLETNLVDTRRLLAAPGDVGDGNSSGVPPGGEGGGPYGGGPEGIADLPGENLPVEMGWSVPGIGEGKVQIGFR